MLSLILAQVQTVDSRTAQRYSTNPSGYEAPLADILAELLERNQEFAGRLEALLARYEAAQKVHTAGSGHQATLTGTGVISQGSRQMAGERGVAGSSAGGDIITGDANIRGNVTIRDSTGVGLGSGQVSANQGIGDESLAQIFAALYRQIETKAELAPQERADLKAGVADIEAEAAAKTDPAKIDDSFLARRLRNIERMAPDILDTIATTTVNPVAGLKGVWDKIRAKAEEIKAARAMNN